MDEILLGLAGPGATPRDDQLDAIEALLEPRARVLVVQATGWGKSAVYWAATAAIRSRGGGPTIVISPLLALMRNQVEAASKAGLRAASINSSNPDDWPEVMEDLLSDRIDVLLISPERLGNPSFARRFDAIRETVGLIVIDEAHCISDWGHDFRPDYQRLTRMILTSPHAAVLTTTATANARVQEDIAHQLGPDTMTFRGTLARESLRLSVIPSLSPLERYAWVSEALRDLPGSGIVYVLTVDEATKLTGFLASRGHDVAAYTGKLDAIEREEIEARLRQNAIKAVVATSALGMGYDKPDLGFCIHIGSPNTPVAYYQQVGRAGRALDDAIAVLLPSETDQRIWDFFATASIPKEADAVAVLDQLEHGPQSVIELESTTGLRRGRLEALLKILAVDDHVEKDGSKWASTLKPYVHDHAKWDRLSQARTGEADIMRRYAAGSGCLMQFLQEVLDDSHGEPCGRCSVCTGILPDPGRNPSKSEIVEAQTYLRGADIIIEPRKLWPSGASRTKRIVACSDGRAVAFADDPAWRDAIAALRASGDRVIPEEFLSGAIATLRRWSPSWSIRPTIVVPAPAPDMSANRRLADYIAGLGKMKVNDVFSWTGAPVPESVPSPTAVAHLEESIGYTGVLTDDGPVLLVSAVARSLWTITLAGALLRESGARDVLPLVLHRRP